MTNTLEKQLDKDINGTRVWSYPCCYMVDGIDRDVWWDVCFNLRNVMFTTYLNEVLLSVPELDMLIEENFKEWDINSNQTKDFLTEVYNTIDTFEGFVIFRKA
jgi:predicted GTPase